VFWEGGELKYINASAWPHQQRLHPNQDIDGSMKVWSMEGRCVTCVLGEEGVGCASTWPQQQQLHSHRNMNGSVKVWSMESISDTHVQMLSSFINDLNLKANHVMYNSTFLDFLHYLLCLNIT
jgi:hypothetical protein